jgi:glutathione peroxidase
VREVPGLVALGRKYHPQLQVLFFPCNQFCDEEPGSADEIRAFYCGVHGLPASWLMERNDVNGPRTQQAYKFLRGSSDGKRVDWNFTKFVVGRDGQVIGSYPQGVLPAFFDERMPGWLGAAA